MTTSKNASPSQGSQSPSRTYHVRSSAALMVWRRIAGSKSPAEVTTRPLGSTKALMPEMAAFTYHLPVSIARICDICRCWALAAVKPYDALLTGTTTNPAPSSTMARVRAGNEFSKQMGAANGGRPGLSNSMVPCPGVRSTGT